MPKDHLDNAPTPIRELARADSDTLTPTFIAARLPRAITIWHSDIARDGRPNQWTTEALGCAGLPAVEALAPWVRAAPADKLLRCLNSLHTIVTPHADILTDERLTATATLAWTDALRRLRRHMPARPKRRLLLDVAEVMAVPDGATEEQVWDARAEGGFFEVGGRPRIVCYQRMFVGVSMMSPYIVQLDAHGRAVASRRTDRWPVADAATAGLRELLSEYDGDGLFKPKGWVMVFESRVADFEQDDWRDGAEEFTATRDGMRPGVVVQVRRQRSGDNDLLRAGPVYVLPKRSMLRGQSARQVAWVAECCREIEGMLGCVGDGQD